jgi:hypothetical protein
VCLNVGRYLGVGTVGRVGLHSTAALHKPERRHGSTRVMARPAIRNFSDSGRILYIYFITPAAGLLYCRISRYKPRIFPPILQLKRAGRRSVPALYPSVLGSNGSFLKARTEEETFFTKSFIIKFISVQGTALVCMRTARQCSWEEKISLV